MRTRYVIHAGRSRHILHLSWLFQKGWWGICIGPLLLVIRRERAA